MINVNEAAKMLGVTPTRVRAMLNDGVLCGKKQGRQWAIYEWSVQKRLGNARSAGRPRLDQAVSKTSPGFRTAEAHELYLGCKKTLSQGVAPNLLFQAESAEEQEFFIHVYNFFLAKKCTQLVDEGVF